MNRLDDSRKGIASVLPTKEGGRVVACGLLLAILMLGTGLRLYELDSDSMWADEIRTASQASQDLVSAVTPDENYTHPPLVDVVTWCFIAISGNSDFAVRLQAALFGSLSIALIYKMGETFWTKKEGVIAALLLAANAYHIQYSQEARSYSLMVFLALFSLIFLTRALRKNESRFWVGFIVCTSLSLYNHYFAFLFLPAEVAYAACVIAQNWTSYRRRNGRTLESDASHGPSLPARQTLMFCLSLAVVGLLYIPWLPALQTHMAFFTGYQGGTAAAGGSLESSLSFLGATLKEYSGISGIGLLLWVGAFVLGLAACDLKRIALVAFWVATPFVFVSVVQSGYPSKPRYVLFILPVCLLVIARGITAVTRSIGVHLLGSDSDRQWPLAIMTMLAVLAVASPSIAALRDYYPRQKEDWRGAAAFLQESMGASDIIIADGQAYDRGGDAPRTASGLAYYFSLHDEDVTILGAGKHLGLKMGEVSDPEAQVWGVLWHASSLANLDRLDGQIRVVELPQVAIIRLTSPGGDRYENAITVLEALKLIQPNLEARFDLYLALADVHREQGKTAEAAADLAQAEWVRPQFQQAYTDLGDEYLWLGFLQNAENAYLGATRLSPGERSVQGDLNAYLGLGSTYDLQGRPQDAVAAYQQLVSLDPTFVLAYVKLGNAYRNLAEPFEALAVYQQGLEIEPDSAQLCLLLGETYLMTGSPRDSVTAFERALQIAPTNAEAQRMLQLLSHSLETDIPYPLSRALAWQVAILGYDLRPASTVPGGTVELTIWWQALQEMERDYTMFIHVVGPEGGILVQEDRMLEHNRLPTSEWRPGELVKDEHVLRLPPDAEPGEYTVMVGAYYWKTGERLSIWDADGDRVAGDAILLKHVSISE